MKIIQLAAMAICLMLYGLTANAQINLVTQGLNSGGGHQSQELSLDFAIGQIQSFSIDTDNIKGNMGILQVIPQGATSTQRPFDFEVSIYPNPTIDRVQIDYPCTESLSLKLINSTGKLIMDTPRIECKTNIDLYQFPPGTYHLLLQSSDRKMAYKLIKI